MIWLCGKWRINRDSKSLSDSDVYKSLVCCTQYVCKYGTHNAVQLDNLKLSTNQPWHFSVEATKCKGFNTYDGLCIWSSKCNCNVNTVVATWKLLQTLTVPTLWAIVVLAKHFLWHLTTLKSFQPFCIRSNYTVPRRIRTAKEKKHKTALKRMLSSFLRAGREPSYLWGLDWLSKVNHSVYRKS